MPVHKPVIAGQRLALVTMSVCAACAGHGYRRGQHAGCAGLTNTLPQSHAINLYWSRQSGFVRMLSGRQKGRQLVSVVSAASGLSQPTLLSRSDQVCSLRHIRTPACAVVGPGLLVRCTITTVCIPFVSCCPAVVESSHTVVHHWRSRPLRYAQDMPQTAHPSSWSANADILLRLHLQCQACCPIPMAGMSSAALSAKHGRCRAVYVGSECAWATDLRVFHSLASELSQIPP